MSSNNQTSRTFSHHHKKQPFTNIFSFFDHSKLDWQKKSKVYYHPQINQVVTDKSSSKGSNTPNTSTTNVKGNPSSFQVFLSSITSTSSSFDSQRLEKTNISSIAASKNILFLSDDHGNIHTVDTHKKETSCFVGIFTKTCFCIRVVTPKKGNEFKGGIGTSSSSEDGQKVKSSYLIAIGTDYKWKGKGSSNNTNNNELEDDKSMEEFNQNPTSAINSNMIIEEVKIKVFEWKGAFKSSDLLTNPKTEILIPKYDKEDKLFNQIDNFEVSSDLKFLAIPRGKFVYLYNDVGKKVSGTSVLASSLLSGISGSGSSGGSSENYRSATIQALPSNSSITSLGFLSNPEKQGNWVLFATDKNDVYRWDLARSLSAGFVKIHFSSATLINPSSNSGVNSTSGNVGSDSNTISSNIGNSEPIEYGCTCVSTPFFAPSFLEHQDNKNQQKGLTNHSASAILESIGRYHSAFIVLRGDEIHAFKYNQQTYEITTQSTSSVNGNSTEKNGVLRLPSNVASRQTLKKKMFWYQNYLGLVRVEGGAFANQTNVKGNVVTNLYDLNNTYIAYDFRTQNLNAQPTPSQSQTSIDRNRKYTLLEVVPMYQQGVDTGTVFLIVRKEGPMGKETGSENQIYQLKEKPPQSKLELLIKKYQYKYAIELAKTIQQLDYDAFNSETRRKYGDYLFSQGRYQQAVRQYMQTIPLVEPSYVIRKFLDSQKNAYLIQYLLKLHMEKKNNKDHTTLLLNCFMRLDDHSEEQIQLMTNVGTSGITTSKTSNMLDDLNPLDTVEDDEELETDQTMSRFMELVDQRDKLRILEEFIHPRNCKLLNYDVETAIRVLRENGYRDEALKLAETNAPLINNPEKQRILNDWVIKIYIEDFAKWNEDNRLPEYKLNYKKALRHIESLDLEQAKDFMHKYGKKLVSNLPERGTNLLIRLCTQYRSIPVKKQKNQNEIVDNIDDKRRTFITQSACEELQLDDKELSRCAVNHHSGTNFDQAPEDYIFCFSDKENANQFWLMVFLEVVTSFHRDSHQFTIDKVVYNTLIELYLHFWNKKEGPRQDDDDLANHKTPAKPYYIVEDLEDNISSPSPILTPTTPNANTSNTPQIVENSLYGPKIDGSDEYYRIYPVHYADITTPYRLKIMDILQQRSFGDESKPKYDREHALVLVQSSKFREGILYLYQVLGLHYDIIQYHMDKEGVDPDRKFQDILARCREKECRDDRNVWIQALSYYAKGPGSEEPNTEKYLTTLLDDIKDNNVVPPLLVVDILSQNSRIKLSTIKQYLQNKLKSEQDSTKDQTTTIKELQKETQKLQTEIEELRTSAKIFQLTQCSLCNSQLDLPAVHFMCMHSYHQRCLEKDECPKCAEKNKSYLTEMENLKRAKDTGGRYGTSKQEQRDNFFKRLATNGFGVVAREFGTGSIGQNIQSDPTDMLDMVSFDDKL
ncbi:hypothetical protein ABK040_010411 [Willaertia magna]